MSGNLGEKLKSLFGTDQPGRILAVFVLAPLIFMKGLKYKDVFLIVFAVVLFLWDLYWLLTEPARRTLASMDTFKSSLIT